MAATSLVETSQVSRYGTTSGDCSFINEDLLKSIDTSRIDNKIDFFRFMGLEIRKVRDTACPTDANDKNNNDKVCPTSAKRSPRSSGVTKNCGLAVESLVVRPKVTKIREDVKKTGNSGDTFDYRSIVASLRECSVAIIGEKCRVCGQSFKCIVDLQHHMRKKHKKKKPKTKLLLLKIGDEIISRVPIRRKHFKRMRKRSYDLATMPYNEDEIRETSSCNGEISQNEKNDEIRLVEPFVVLEDSRDVAVKRSNVRRITERDVPSSTPGHGSNASSNSYEDEDVSEVLRIRRSPWTGASINHETPNRTERELLLSDAIREFDRIANDHQAGMTNLVNGKETMAHGCNDVVDDYCWLDDAHLTNPHLDLVENNCSYHIRNDWDMDVPLELVTPMVTHLDPKYFDDEDTCSPDKQYPKDHYDIPDFIDYSECMNTRASFNSNNNDSNNNNSIYGLESPFCEKTRRADWNRLTRNPTTFNCDIRHGTEGNVDLSVLIKEEIMLDEVL